MVVGSRASAGSASSAVWPEGEVVGSASSWWGAVSGKMPSVVALMGGSGRRWGWGEVGAAGAGRCALALRWGYQTDPGRWWGI